MDRFEAEKFFKKHDGYSFAMWDLEHEKYEQYKKLKISKKQENIWLVQKAEEYSTDIDNSDKPWLIYMKMGDMLASYVNTKTVDLMLNTAKKTEDKLDAKNSLSFAETIIGRSDVSTRTGWIYWAYDNRCKRQAVDFCLLADRLLGRAKEAADSHRHYEHYYAKLQIMKSGLKI